ncbi:MAG: hypothetical protein JWQ66_1797 [Mucilaginibacter sp.]|nr:hypothetical protein [Mucilaginibacter sp.]
MCLKLFERNLCFVFNCSDSGKSIKEHIYVLIVLLQSL